MTKHYTIPFFIQHKGCSHQCVFCNQKNIAAHDMISPDEIPATIEKYLSTISRSDTPDIRVEVGFFGGTFTALSRRLQDSFLVPVREYIENKQVHGIRLSTRPDCIDKDTLVF